MGITCGCVPISSAIPQNKIQSVNSIPKDTAAASDYDFNLHSRITFICLNDLRTEPEKYSKLIKDTLELIGPADSNELKGPPESAGQQESNKEKFIQEFLTDFVKNHDDMLSIVKEIGDKIEQLIPKHLRSLEWSENLFLAISNYQKDHAEFHVKENHSGNFFHFREPSVIFSTTAKKNLKVSEYELKGFYKPEIAIWKLLIEHKEKIYEFLSDDYYNIVTFSYCECEGNFDTFITKFFFLYEVRQKDIIINGVNPMTGIYQPFTLYESFFKDITYKDQIVGGDYVYTEEGLNVIFTLANGEKKEELIKLATGLI